MLNCKVWLPICYNQILQVIELYKAKFLFTIKNQKKRFFNPLANTGHTAKNNK